MTLCLAGTAVPDGEMPRTADKGVGLLRRNVKTGAEFPVVFSFTFDPGVRISDAVLIWLREQPEIVPGSVFYDVKSNRLRLKRTDYLSMANLRDGVLRDLVVFLAHDSSCEIAIEFGGDLLLGSPSDTSRAPLVSTG